MKKIIIIFIFLFLLTGCSCNVNVKIENNFITKNISINIPYEERNDKTTYDYIKDSVYEIKNDTEILYSYNVTSSKDSNPLTASISNNIYDINFDNTIYYCYDNQTISYENNIFRVSTSDKFTCFDDYPILDNVYINLTTEYKVIDNNADNVSNGVYTWHITKDNPYKSINLTLDTTKENEEYTSVEKQKENTNKTILIVVTFLLITSLIFGIGFVIKSKKSNKI